jgi:hypothetical protein
VNRSCFLTLAACRTPFNPWDTRSPLCVGRVLDCAMMFSLVRALPSPASVEDCSPLFGRFIGVGSEEARLRAGLRPPLKLHGRFSRMQLLR